MKLLPALFALGLAPYASASSSSELFASFGKPQDAGSVVQKLTGMMAASKQKLALAERRHAKVVKKVRKEAAADLNNEATAYGKYISGYAAELSQAQSDFLGVVRSVRAGLAAAEASPTSSNDWKDPDTEKKAKLNAQLASADRAIKKADRRRERHVRESEERGEETLEDEAQKLGMKVGDMTPLVDEAKKTLDAVAENKTAAAAGDAVVQSNVTTAKKVNLTGLEEGLESAVAKNQAAIAGANKRLDGFLSKTDKDVAATVAKLQEKVENAQREEISKVLGKPQAKAAKPAPATKAAKPAPATKSAQHAPVKAAAAAKEAKAAVKVASAKAH